MKTNLSKLLITGLLAATAACATTKSQQQDEATFVLVHGALFTSSGWELLQNELTSYGVKSVSLNLPGRSGDGLDPKDVNLQVAAEKVRELVMQQKGKVILVGHSQGGAVIIEALGGMEEKVLGLVHVAAVLPLQGEIPFQGLEPTRDVGFGKVAELDAKKKIFKVNKKGPVHEIFFADISKVEAQKAIAGMVNEPSQIGLNPVTTSNTSLLKTPMFYVETLKDQVISIETQRNYYKRVPGIRVFSMNSSHSPFLSQPAELAKYLMQIQAEIE